MAFIGRVLLLLGLALLTTACGGGESPTPGASKPSAPITLSIEPKGDTERGEVGEFEVRVTALAPASRVAIEVDLPEDIALFSGDRSWEGPMARGEVHSMVFAIRIPENEKRIIRVDAEMISGPGRFKTRAVHVIGQGRSEGNHDGSRVIEGTDGSIREYGLD